MADVDETDVSRGLGGFRQVGLGDSVAEGDGGGVIDQTQRVEAGDGSGVSDGSSLDICVVPGNSDDDVGNSLLELGGSGITKLAKVGSEQLRERERRGLAKVVDLIMSEGPSM